MFGALTGLHRRIRAFARDTRGYAVMSTLAIFLFLFVLCAAVYAIGETIRERIKMQNACDAAAYSAAVVQADGLSRMACINRAMSWSYVQMTGRQMDYITYRWLKLACSRFEEDQRNAEEYASQLILAVDKQLGWWAILEAALSGAVDMLFDFDCATGGHESADVGLSCWCGLGVKTSGGKLDVNRALKLNSIVLPNIKGLNLNSHESLTSILKVLKFFDRGKGDGPETWGQLLGTLIDYDKKNIACMNRALQAVNAQMTVSMRETAQNVLKTSLKDGRCNASDALSDYYVALRVPNVRNPYAVDSDEHLDGRVDSFFSPLRNTEADERLFLQMNTSKHADRPLSAFFPVLAVGNSDTAFGLDQWFVRGKGTYVDSDRIVDDAERQMSRYDEPDFWEKPSAIPSWRNGRSGWIDNGKEEPTARLEGTVRSEGELGIQRAYKDAQLNETKEGFLGRQINRGNHLLDAMDLVNLGISSFMDFIGGGDGGNGDDIEIDDDDGLEDGDTDVSDGGKLEQTKEDLRKKISAKTAERLALLEKLRDPNDGEDKDALDRKVEALDAEIDELQIQLEDLENLVKESGEHIGSAKKPADSGTPKRDSGDTGSGGVAASFASLFGKIFNAVADHFLGKYVDISASCKNRPGKSFDAIPMCKKAAETQALYADYRWASCKYYCLTKLWTWSLSLIFGYHERDGEKYYGHNSSHKIIYCDRPKHTFKEFKLLKIKIRGNGYGHFGFPKWFCGTTPSYMGDEFIREHFGSGFLAKIARGILKYFPPLAPEKLKGDVHGYMDGTLDFGSDGFLRPIRPVWGSGTDIPRDEYCSCAPFFDGTFRFNRGQESWAGLIRGHARIYGDDKEIFDNRYVGARCQPWVLNEKFFSGEGTIVVGAAKRFTNPFSHLFGFLQQEKDVPSATVLSAFDIPRDNYMWTMSAARAAVRHRRRNGAFDGPRQYQVTYDPTSDTENLAYNGGFVIHDANADAWTPDLTGWESRYNGGRPVATRGRNLMHPAIFDGCVCHERNERRFVRTWNLCESDWDATLLPLRFCGERATLRLRMDGSGEPVAFREQDYDRRQRLLYQAETCNRIIGVDDVLGAGTNWVWDSAIKLSSSSESSNPFVNAVWRRASDDYFGIPNDLNSETLKHGVQLKNKLPDESDGKATARFWELLQWNRVL